MNNIQLAVLLRQYASALDDQIDAVEDSLPGSMKQKCQGFMGPFEWFPCTEGLRKLHGGMVHDIRLLEVAE